MILAIICLHKISKMNQCLLNIIEGMVLITFNEVVEKGSVIIRNVENDYDLILQEEITKTNFKNIDCQHMKGRYKIEISTGKEQFFRIVNIK